MYRNDHDAALARIDVLEDEVSRLHARLAEKPLQRPPRAKHRGSWWLAGIVAAVIGIAVGAMRPSAPQPSGTPSAGGAYDDPVHRVCALP